MVACRTAEVVIVVSEFEVLVMFVTLEDEGNARNISQQQNIV